MGTKMDSRVAATPVGTGSAAFGRSRPPLQPGSKGTDGVSELEYMSIMVSIVTTAVDISSPFHLTDSESALSPPKRPHLHLLHPQIDDRQTKDGFLPYLEDTQSPWRFNVAQYTPFGVEHRPQGMRRVPARDPTAPSRFGVAGPASNRQGRSRSGIPSARAALTIRRS